MVTIIASEGGAGYYPENTAYAVRQSLAQNLDGCELDFHLTADGVFVAHHDYKLKPALTRDAKGAWLTEPGPLIKQATLAELRQYDVGAINPNGRLAKRYPQRASHSPETVPTFAEIELAFLESENSAAELWFEAKTDPTDPEQTTTAELYVDQLSKVLSESPLLQRTVLIAFDWRLLELAQQHLPGIQTGYLTIDFSWFDFSRIDFSKINFSKINEDRSQQTILAPDPWFGNFHPDRFGGSLPDAVQAAGGAYWSPYFRDLNHVDVTRAHELGLKVSTWGADTEEEISSSLAFGVDSITTGYADRVRK